MINFFLASLLIITCWIIIRAAGRTSAISFFAILNTIQAITALFIAITDSRKEDFRLGDVFFSAMPMADISKAMPQTLSFFLFLNIIAIISVVIASLLVKRRRYGSYSELISGALRSKDGAASVLTSPIILIGLVPLYIVSAVHYVSLDHSLLWQSQNYLTIKTPEEIGLTNPILSTYHVMLRLVGLVCIVLLEVNIKSRSYLIAFLCIPLILYALFLMTAGNSRWIPLYFFAWAATRTILYGRSSLFSLVLAFVGFFTFVMVINGRAADTFGVSQISRNIESVNMTDFGTYGTGIWVNVFEGGLNVANSYLWQPNFSDRYQWGSISPLPSAIDGFEKFRDLDKAKFAVHVPMGGLGEVAHFSFIIKCIFFITLGATLALLQAVNRRGVSAALLVINIFCCYVFYLLSTYSLRTSWRYVIAVFIIALAMYVKNKNSVKKSRNSIRKKKVKILGENSINNLSL